MSDTMDEAGWTNQKMMQQAARDDAWKDAKKLADVLGQEKPGSWKKEPEQEFDLEPDSGEELKLANETGTGGIMGFQAPLSDDDQMSAVRELIKQKVKEVVRKKAGGGGYALYAPNPGKKGKAKPVGSFPTKLGAKRAELARYPPNDPGKLKRLRKEVDRLQKNPKKAAEREKAASKQKGTDKGEKKEAVVREGTPFAPTSAAQPAATPTAPGTNIHKDLPGFMNGLKLLPKDGPQRGKYVTAHMSDPGFLSALQKHPQGKQLHQQLTGFLNSKANAGPAGAKVSVSGESVDRRKAFYERTIISKIISRSLTESLFREEKTESEWDDYISKLSKNALAGDSKFQNLQRNISKKTESILDGAFNTIRKAVGKNVKLKSYGIKHDAQSGQTYMAFGASFEDVTAEPIYLHVEGGVPKIDLSTNAKVALTKADPDKAKLFRAELVTVQERVLDNMDELAKSIQARDKYLSKLESEVDGYVAGLTPLQVSLLKQLLVKKYRKIS